MEDAMDGEEFPSPGLAYLVGTARLSGVERANSYYRDMTAEDEEIFDARIDIQVYGQYLFDSTTDLVVMHARTSCPGVKPAMKNLAVFLKYS